MILPDSFQHKKYRKVFTADYLVNVRWKKDGRKKEACYELEGKSSEIASFYLLSRSVIKCLQCTTTQYILLYYPPRAVCYLFGRIYRVRNIYIYILYVATPPYHG